MKKKITKPESERYPSRRVETRREIRETEKTRNLRFVGDRLRREEDTGPSLPSEEEERSIDRSAPVSAHRANQEEEENGIRGRRTELTPALPDHGGIYMYAGGVKTISREEMKIKQSALGCTSVRIYISVLMLWRNKTTLLASGSVYRAAMFYGIITEIVLYPPFL